MTALTIYDSFKDEIEKSLKDGLLKSTNPFWKPAAKIAAERQVPQYMQGVYDAGQITTNDMVRAGAARYVEKSAVTNQIEVEPPKYDWKQLSIDWTATAEAAAYTPLRHTSEEHDKWLDGLTKPEPVAGLRKPVLDMDEWQKARDRFLEIFSQGNCTDPGLSAILKGEDVDDTPQAAPDFSADPGRVRAFACMEEVKCPGNWEMRFDGESQEWVLTLPLWNETLEFRLLVDEVEDMDFDANEVALFLAHRAEDCISAWEERQGKRW